MSQKSGIMSELNLYYSDLMTSLGSEWHIKLSRTVRSIHPTTPMSEKEQQFTIQPHPAKDNVPPQLGAGPNNGLEPNFAALNARGGPYIPTQDQLNSLEAPLSREELVKRTSELNKEP